MTVTTETAETAVEPAMKPATTHVPKPTTAFIVANPDWDPVRDRCYGRETFSSPAEAQSSLRYATRVGNPKVLLRAVTTYKWVADNFADVEGGGDD